MAGIFHTYCGLFLPPLARTGQPCFSTHVNNAERTILGLAQRQHGAICRRQALECGMSGRSIDHRLASGEWVRVFQGAYRLAGTECTWEQKAMAGVLAAGVGAVASHRAAAALHGMPGAPRWAEVTVTRPRQVQVEGLIAHQTRLLAPGDAGRLSGIPVTTPGRTIADLARVYSTAKLGPMLDHALARRLVG
ncbi:MAG TPA: type IV toxin-antitoxin system AbiEi family antitoxin domain-containing protein, partial [Actinomycetota bacterium]